MEKERIAYLMSAYVNDRISLEDKVELMEYIAMQDCDQEVYQVMYQDWESSRDHKTVAADRAEQIFQSIVTKVKRPKVNFLKAWVGWAAAVLILTASFFVFIRTENLQMRTNLTAAFEKESDTSHFQVSLPDGSKVILNSHSRLSYKDGFNGKNREVYLTGEGFFDVKHNPDKPFIVHTGNLKTVVLGTAFNVKALANDGAITVTVTRGKVAVQKGERLLGLLQPNEQIVYRVNLEKADRKTINADTVIAWQEKDLFFQNITMEEAVSMISEKFNVNIQFQSDLGKKCRFTATFVNKQSLSEVLDAITTFNNATYTQSTDRIIISGSECNK
jgi:transmembrane sensor